jgi:hypothetical protein
MLLIWYGMAEEMNASGGVNQYVLWSGWCV